MVRMPVVFVSHAFDDRGLVDKFVDIILKLGCGMPVEQIFYSSGEDTGVPSGRDLIHHVREQVSESVLVIAIITPTFQTRPVCVAELGAAWGRSDNLFPVAAPGMQRTDMEGVLRGMTVRYLNDSGALDELRDQIKKLTGIESSTATWGRHKGQWLREVDNLTGELSRPETVTPEELEQVRSDLDGAREALGAAEAEAHVLRERINEYQRAVTVEERKAALLPKDEKQRFDVLVEEAHAAMRGLDHQIVGDAMYFDRFRDGMPFPNAYEDQYRNEAAHTAQDAGFLKENSYGLLAPDEEVLAVAKAQAAVQDLHRFFSGTSQEFDAWFQQEYGAPPQLRRKAIWDQLLG